MGDIHDASTAANLFSQPCRIFWKPCDWDWNRAALGTSSRRPKARSGLHWHPVSTRWHQPFGGLRPAIWSTPGISLQASGTRGQQSYGPAMPRLPEILHSGGFFCLFCGVMCFFYTKMWSAAEEGLEGPFWPVFFFCCFVVPPKHFRLQQMLLATCWKLRKYQCHC